MVKPKARQLELDLFQDPTQRPADSFIEEQLAPALRDVMNGRTDDAYRWLLTLSPQDRYRIRVACRILILEAAKPDRIHSS